MSSVPSSSSCKCTMNILAEADINKQKVIRGHDTSQVSVNYRGVPQSLQLCNSTNDHRISYGATDQISHTTHRVNERVTPKHQISLWLMQHTSAGDITMPSFKFMKQSLSRSDMSGIKNEASQASTSLINSEVPTDSMKRDVSVPSLSRFSDHGHSVKESKYPDTPIRKCETMISLSNTENNSAKTSVVRNRDRDCSSTGTYLNFLKRLSPSSATVKSARYRAPLHQVKTSPTSLRGEASDLGGRCETILNFTSTPRLSVLPVKPVNRLRVASNSQICSRCNSIVSMASQFSLNMHDEVSVLCKLCLREMSPREMVDIQDCHCQYCQECMRAYVTFEIEEGAYEISCPDAECATEGILTMQEIECIVSRELVEKHKKFRLNREVDLDTARTWCPRAGCETMCHVCQTEKYMPVPVHCPKCTIDFCSNCKASWHQGMTCETYGKWLAKDNPAEMGSLEDSGMIKRCPMCHVPIERDAGCAQMMCKRCKHVFCWYCLDSLDDDFLLRHYDSGPCKNKLGHSRASVIWHRTQVIGIFAGFGILLLVASPLLLLAAPCILCCKCKPCNRFDEDLIEESVTSAATS